VGRPCQGDDELLEGNKIGLCTTTLREAEGEGARLDPGLAAACLAAVEAGKPLPDVRTLELLAARFEACRELFAPIPALAAVAPRPPGVARAGAACSASAECAHGHYCARKADRNSSDKGACAAQKAAGASCAGSDECLGRCSAQAGQRCMAYCGSG
jgi:hypothetical protein